MRGQIQRRRLAATSVTAANVPMRASATQKNALLSKMACLKFMPKTPANEGAWEKQRGSERQHLHGLVCPPAGTRATRTSNEPTTESRLSRAPRTTSSRRLQFPKPLSVLRTRPIACEKKGSTKDSPGAPENGQAKYIASTTTAITIATAHAITKATLPSAKNGVAAVRPDAISCSSERESDSSGSGTPLRSSIDR